MSVEMDEKNAPPATDADEKTSSPAFDGDEDKGFSVRVHVCYGITITIVLQVIYSYTSFIC
jgi:hypothetical protein